ncbi:MAG: twin-arginine translocase TatA/TatE family subunit [Rubrobacteraceae bacterium]
MGPFELLILLFVVFLVLGPKRITAIFRSLGRGARDFTNELGKPKTDEPNDKELTEEGENTPKRKD